MNCVSKLPPLISQIISLPSKNIFAGIFDSLPVIFSDDDDDDDDENTNGSAEIFFSQNSKYLVHLL